ncbi:MAG: response regulator [Elusimicrobia bacterium]|nr:response regulator [Elusimicrobiota bacterium]
MARKILVADDEADNRAIITAALTASGYSVCQAQDGEQAVAAALSEAPDLILLDMAMPVMSGWDAARRIKAMPQTKDIPILAFTAYALAGDDLKAQEAGCDGYVPKPCIPKEVVAKIRATVGE